MVVSKMAIDYLRRWDVMLQIAILVLSIAGTSGRTPSMRVGVRCDLTMTTWDRRLLLLMEGYNEENPAIANEEREKHYVSSSE